MKHKSEDYKISAVKFYLKMKEVCNIFECKKQSLSRWVKRYQKDNSIKRYNRNSISYKITKAQVNYAIDILKKNEQLTMFGVRKLVKKKFKNFNITAQHLGQVIRNNNKTRKRTRHKHFPKIRYN